MHAVPSSYVRQLGRSWSGSLAHYGTHRNDEHLIALFEEAVQYVGLNLEDDLSGSEFWCRVPLRRRAAVLLYLVDRGVVNRAVRQGKRVYEPLAHAESWVASQKVLRPYLRPTLELLVALRHELTRRSHSRRGS